MMRSCPDQLSRQPHTDRFNKCMMLLEQLGEIYWHASFYHDFFKLAALHSQRSTANTHGQEQDPLVAFFNDHMPTKQPIGKAPPDFSSQSVSRRRTPTGDGMESNPSRRAATPNRDNTADQLSMPTTTSAAAHAGFLAPTSQTPAPFALGSDDLDLGDVVISDTNLQLFEDWLDEFGYFHNIFPSA